ncbi:MAG: HlyD family efflux transporter periplasmic adaptor subunit [Gammaproteobacteria bacterium]|nr:HlyD family efflux transporter periplasmic adaptor subunit [Gammaproteobacteria bacterium]
MINETTNKPTEKPQRTWLPKFPRLVAFFRDVKRHVDVWRISWEEAKRETPLRRLDAKELEFLPAVIEIQETPPAPIGRAVAYTIIVLFAVGVLWATFGKIDIIAVAQGKIIPSGGSKVIQPLETGVIKAIHVRDGSRVKQGDVLIEIDTTADPDRDRLTNEYYAAVTEIARLRALLAGEESFDPPKGADAKFVEIQRKRLRDQLAELQALERQSESYKKLYAQEYVSQMQYLEVERQRADKMQQHSAALAEAETRAHSLSKEALKAGTRADQQHLTAPIDGTVQQLVVQTVGGVVTPAQQLMVIAPEEGHLEIEAWVENKDVGFVNADQQAEIKVESFPFTRYGTIEGKVLTLSGDAVPVEKVGLVYTARVSMDKNTIEVENGKQVRLSPGMTVSVEIKTGKRRLIEYFLSPLLRGINETAHER